MGWSMDAGWMELARRSARFALATDTEPPVVERYYLGDIHGRL